MGGASPDPSPPPPPLHPPHPSISTCQNGRGAAGARDGDPEHLSVAMATREHPLVAMETPSRTPPPTARARCHGAVLWLPWQPGAFGTTAPVAIETPSIPRLPWRPPSIAWLLWRPRTPPGCYGDPPSVAMETPLLRVPPESPEHPPVAMVTPGTTAPVAMETPITPPLYPLPWRQPAWCAPPPPTSVATATAALLPRRRHRLLWRPPHGCHGDAAPPPPRVRQKQALQREQRSLSTAESCSRQ